MKIKFLFTICLSVFFIQIQDIQAACYTINNNIKYGTRDSSYSTSVSVLQGFLREYNFLSPGPVGFFGPTTFKAVKFFQQAQNIPSTGFVGPLTRAKIKTFSCEGVNNTVPVVDPASSNPWGNVPVVNVPVARSFITVESPNPNSSFIKGNVYTIRWSTENLANTDLVLYAIRNDGTSYYIATVPSYYLSYAWTIPSSLESSIGYRIKISAKSDTVVDYSDTYFSIKDPVPTIDITNTLSGVTINLDSPQTQNITWQYGGFANISRTASAYLIFSDGTKCLIGSTPIENKVFPLNIRRDYCIGISKVISPGRYSVSISAVTESGAVVTDYTESFTVTSNAVDPSLMKVLTPNGGQNITATQPLTITWTTPTSITATDPISLNLEVYTSTGVSPYKTIPIVSSMNNTKTYTWTIPQNFAGASLVTGDRYKIALSTSKNSSFKDVSDNFFTIHPLNRVIQLNSLPQTAIARDTDFTMTWNKSGFLDTDKINISFSPVGSAASTVLKLHVAANDGSASLKIPLGTTLNSYKINVTPISYVFGAGSVTSSTLFALTGKSGGSITAKPITNPAYNGAYTKVSWVASNLTGSTISIRLVTSTGAVIAGVSPVVVTSTVSEKEMLIPQNLPAGSYKFLIEGVSDTATITAYTSEFAVSLPTYTLSLDAIPTSMTKNTSATVSWSGAYLRSTDGMNIVIKDSLGNSITAQSTYGAGSVSVRIPNTFVSGTATIYATSTAVGYTRNPVTTTRTVTIADQIFPTITVTSPSVGSTTTLTVDASWQNTNFTYAASPITSLRVYLIQKKRNITNSTIIESGLSPTSTSIRIPITNTGTIGTLTGVGIDPLFGYQIKVEALAGTTVVATGLTGGVFYIAR